MTYRAWWAARRLLFEERFGVLIREDEQRRRAKDAQLAADYERTVAILQKRQQEP